MRHSITLKIVVLLCALLAPILAESNSLGELELKSCEEQFIGGIVANVPTTNNTSQIYRVCSKQHLCYQDDEFSFFAIEYCPEFFAPRWAAYKLNPDNYKNHCKTYSRNKAACYFRKETWQDFLDCEKGNDPFHPDHILIAREVENILYEGDFMYTGHDKGHLAPRNAFSWHICASYQTFTMANMSPQRGFLNQFIWKNLESWVLKLGLNEGPLYVVSGTVFDSFPHSNFEIYKDGLLDASKIYSKENNIINVATQNRINFVSKPRGHILKPLREPNLKKIKEKRTQNLRLPTGYYKVIYRPAKDEKLEYAIGFLIPHTFENLNFISSDKSPAFWSFASSIDIIESVSGTKFSGIPAALKKTPTIALIARLKAVNYSGLKDCDGDFEPKGVAQNTTKSQRLEYCTDKLVPKF